MKPIKGAAIATAVTLAFLSGSGFAAGEKSKAAKPPVSEKKKAALAAEANTSTKPPPGQVVYQVLLGEIALQRGNLEVAVGAYADLAYRTRDPKVLERATEVASAARRFDIAYETAKLWVDVEPDSLSARQTLAAILVLQNRVDELGPQISLLLERDKENLSDNLLRLNRMLVRYTDKAAVYRMLQPVLAPYDGIAESHFALATAAFHAGEREKSLQEIRKARELRPDWDAAVLFESQIVARESPDAAIEILERFVSDYPKSREVRLHLARGLVAEKRYAEARKHFDRLLADNPDSPELIYPVAILALQQNEVATAEPLLRTLLERGEPTEKSIAAFYLGQIAEERQAYAEAMNFYRQVISGEQFAVANIRIAQLIVKTGGGLTAAQEQLWASTLRYPPAKIQFIIAEAQLLRDANQTVEALAMLDEVLKAQPNQADVLYDAAMLAEKLGRMDVVEGNLRRVIELQPQNAHAYNALGYSFADRNEHLDEARQLIAKANELQPDDPFILDSLGWVLFKQGDLSGALAYLEKAYAIKPDAEIAAHLGEVLWKLDRRDDAEKMWSAALERHPGNEILQAVRKKFLR